MVCDCPSTSGKLACPRLECEVLFGVSLGGVRKTTLLIRMGMWASVPVAFGLRLLVVSVRSNIYSLCFLCIPFETLLLTPTCSPYLGLLPPPLVITKPVD